MLGKTLIEKSFLEIEHKFLTGSTFDQGAFYSALRERQPEKEYSTEVADTYFLVERVPGVVYR